MTRPRDEMVTELRQQYGARTAAMDEAARLQVLLNAAAQKAHNAEKEMLAIAQHGLNWDVESASTVAQIVEDLLGADA